MKELLIFKMLSEQGAFRCKNGLQRYWGGYLLFYQNSETFRTVSFIHHSATLGRFVRFYKEFFTFLKYFLFMKSQKFPLWKWNVIVFPVFILCLFVRFCPKGPAFIIYNVCARVRRSIYIQALCQIFQTIWMTPVILFISFFHSNKSFCPCVGCYLSFYTYYNP